MTSVGQNVNAIFEDLQPNFVPLGMNDATAWVGVNNGEALTGVNRSLRFDDG